ncbi:hypothetical protein U3A58_12020 [Algoriphagus sp. C2-6-M1]|uniref:hypothetical protein n=1 Tax=Algoriphagus persicinus TaxID=3108754 RepID=UPI002B3B969C|nr:hypothetical protein [Algoriphagus sp. C2-6-M1]MEB2781120.1 hypothetical protein [Algoriphagus sp. C2-6-M1]
MVRQYLEAANMVTKFNETLILFGFIALISSCANFNVKEILIDFDSDNSGTVEIDFSQYTNGINWDTLYIVRPYSNVKEFQFSNWNLNQLHMLAQSDSEILVLYSFKKRVVGYSLIPRRFDLLQLWEETKCQDDPYIKFDLKRSKFLFVKDGDVYKLVDSGT